MVTAKQNQSKEQAEKKNQAISQLKKLLVQGNRRVEALATVIQHLFTEVPWGGAVTAPALLPVCV